MQSLARFGLLIVGGVVGLVVFLLTASAALVLLAAIAIVAVLVFMWFWIRAKFFGKPFGGQAFEDARKAAQAQRDAANGMFADEASGDAFDDGDVIDAHRTAEGWTVEK